MKKTCDRAEIEGAYSVLLTFEPHPGLVLKNSGTPEIRLLSTIDEKIEILEELGLDCLIIANFTQSLASTSAEDYVKNLIVHSMRARQVIIGHDHAFGRGRSGNIELLKKMGQEYGFSVDAVEPVTAGQETVSSTRVRELITGNQVEKAADLLKRPYDVHGQVVNGSGRGRKIGFPTANIRLFSQYKLVPGNGIYATRTRIDDVMYPSVTYVGTRPTYGLEERVIESHLLDFDGDIYGTELKLYFYKCLRQEEQFADELSLVEAIKQDKQKAEKILQNGGTD